MIHPRCRPAPTGPCKDQAQRNFTDPDSRIRKRGDGFVRGYNTQIAVDAGHQIVVAQHLNAHGTDAPQLPGMLTRIKVNTGRQAQELSADAGYCCERNLKTLNRHHIHGYVATGHIHHGSAGPALRSRSPTSRRCAAGSARADGEAATGCASRS